MKKYRFLFLILFLGIFFFPKDAFAKTTVDYMVIYSPGYEYQNSCDNCQYLDNFAPEKKSDRVGFRFGQSLIQGVTYTMRFTFDVYYSTSSPYYYDFGFYGPAKLGNASFTRSDAVYVDWMNAYQITNTATLTWTQGQNVENFAAELYFEPNLWLLQLNVVDWTLTAQGQGNSDVIINSSQNIIDNQDKNTDRVIDNQNKNQQQTNEKLDKLDDTLNDDDTSSSENQIDGFFNNFEDNHHGLSSVITAPLVFIRNLLNHSCSPLRLQLPFVDSVVNLPCMKSIYQQHFGLFFNLYQTITTGVIAYAVLIRIFATIKGLQDPQNDKIEVFNL